MFSLRKNSGQTILEVLIALTLISLILSGIVVVQLYAIRNVENSRNRSLATALARQQLERARVVRDSEGMKALSACENAPCFINVQLTPEVVLPTGFFQQSLRVDLDLSGRCSSSLTPVPTVYRAEAKVSWEEGIIPSPQVEIYSCLTDWR